MDEDFTDKERLHLVSSIAIAHVVFCAFQSSPALKPCPVTFLPLQLVKLHILILESSKNKLQTCKF